MYGVHTSWFFTGPIHFIFRVTLKELGWVRMCSLTSPTDLYGIGFARSSLLNCNTLIITLETFYKYINCMKSVVWKIVTIRYKKQTVLWESWSQIKIRIQMSTDLCYSSKILGNCHSFKHKEITFLPKLDINLQTLK